MSINSNSINTDLTEKHSDWSVIKLKIDLNQKSPLYVSEGQVWWCQIGQNLGVEINGRNKKDITKKVFFRAVLVFKKYNKNQGLIIPLTESLKVGRFYANFKFQGSDSTALLSQARTIDFKRLSSENNKPIGRIDEKDYKIILENFIKLLEFKPNKKPPKGDN
jgi:mRNA-degrading endonuclease toxin of MazEF toxin-antitoxin module